MRSPFDRHQVVPIVTKRKAKKKACHPGRIVRVGQQKIIRLEVSWRAFSLACPMMKVSLGRLVRYTVIIIFELQGFEDAPDPPPAFEINRRSAWAPSSRQIMPARFDSFRATEPRGSMSDERRVAGGARESSCSGGAVPQVLSGRLLAASQPRTNLKLFSV